MRRANYKPTEDSDCWENVSCDVPVGTKSDNWSKVKSLFDLNVTDTEDNVALRNASGLASRFRAISHDEFVGADEKVLSINQSKPAILQTNASSFRHASCCAAKYICLLSMGFSIDSTNTGQFG